MSETLSNQSVYEVFAHQKTDLLQHLLTTLTELKSVVVYVRTTDSVHELTAELRNANIDVDSLHPKKKETIRQEVLSEFKNGEIRVIVITDAYARSLNIEGIRYGINFNFPELTADYRERSESVATQLITLVTPQDEDDIASLENSLGGSIPRIAAEGFTHDSKDLFTKNRRNAASPNRTKTRGSQSKPLQNKKQKLRKGKKR